MTMYIKTLGLAVFSVVCILVIAGHHVLLSKAGLIKRDTTARIESEPEATPNKRQNTVSYYFDSKIKNLEQKNTINQSMRIISLYTDNCIIFKELRKPTGIIHIQFIPHPKSKFCLDEFTKTGESTRTIKLGADCMHVNIIIHEIMHALGFSHEHQRPDRDRYVHINTNNIKPDGIIQQQFQILPGMETYNVPYDIHSVMHYNEFIPQFAIHESQPIMTFKNGTRQELFTL
ncbi:zinc metalloproteinase nas-12-like [Paramacrobiotus metropolitanus]|uniref:zinc metalloproteinase nas-12-like n=1 Tax=Paramacrobiotus metropolitanus TaxID=2943436 RepID=UPI0024458DB7|nr:zinc metalloproteinase nas-12-like [Paramacrobiotus metropolitanus]